MVYRVVRDFAKNSYLYAIQKMTPKNGNSEPVAPLLRPHANSRLQENSSHC